MVPTVKVMFDMLGLDESHWKSFPNVDVAVRSLGIDRARLTELDQSIQGRDLEAALRIARELVEHFPKAAIPKIRLCEVLLRRGEVTQEREVRANLYPRRGRDPLVLSRLADAFAAAGDDVTALHLVSKLEMVSGSRDPRADLFREMLAGSAASPLPFGAVRYSREWEQIKERRYQLYEAIKGAPTIQRELVLHTLARAEDPLDRELAACALGAWGDLPFDAALAAVRGGWDWLKYYFILSTCRENPDAVGFLIETADPGNPPWLRQAALQVLSKIRTPAVDRYMIKQLSSDQDKQVLDIALEYFRDADDSLLPELERGLEPPAKLPRFRAMGRIGTHGAAQALIRHALVAKLDALESIVQALKDCSSEVAFAALWRLTEHFSSLKTRAEESGDMTDALLWAQKLRVISPTAIPETEILRLVALSGEAQVRERPLGLDAGLEDLLSLRATIDRQIADRFEKTVALMITDLAGFTSWSESHELATVGTLILRYGGLLKPAFEAHGGRVVKTMGDAYLVVFDSARPALACGREVIRRVVDEKLPVQVKVALHYGRVLDYNGDVFGDPVNTVSRLEKCAEAGDMVLSREFLHAVGESLPVEELGPRRFKGKKEDVLVFRIGAG